MTSQPEQIESDSADERQSAHLGNIAFWVSDFDAMRAFYTDVIGVDELASGERPRNWVFYGSNEFSFSLNQAEFTPAESGWTTCPKWGSSGENWNPYMTLYVPDLQEVIARCKAAGIRIRTEEPFSLGEGFGMSIEVMDPDGNAVALTQR
jgi:catechol 2,3-dioxygenase-like lactoylglutathione lyase family enzyme